MSSHNLLPTARPVKTCFACRSSKRRCDKARPRCSLCQHLNIECIYPAEPPGDQLARRPSHSSDTFQTNSLIKGAIAHQLQAIWWTIYSPLEDVPTGGLAERFSPSPLIANLQQIVSNSAIAGAALQACVLTNMGRRQQDLRLLQQAMGIYGAVISNLKKSVEVADLSRLEEHVASCHLLCLYEMMRPSHNDFNLAQQTSAWKSHAAGTCTLIDVLASRPGRSLSSYESDSWKRLSFRLNISNRRTNFNTRAVDEQLQGPEDLRARLHAIMSKIPEVFAHNDELLRFMDSSTDNEIEGHKEALLGFLGTCMELSDEFKVWVTEILSLQQPEADPNQPIQLHDNDRLRLLCHDNGAGFLLAVNECWASQAFIAFQAKHYLDRVQQRISLELTDTTLPLLPEDPKPYIAQIAKSAKRLLSTHAGLWVSEQAIYPLSTAINVLAMLDMSESSDMKLLQSAVFSSLGIQRKRISKEQAMPAV